MSDRLQEAKSLLVATEGVPSSDWLDTDRPKMRDLLVWAVSEVQRLRFALEHYVDLTEEA